MFKKLKNYGLSAFLLAVFGWWGFSIIQSGVGDPDEGRRKSRFFKEMLSGVADTIGHVPTGILVILIGVVLAGAIIRRTMRAG